MLKVVRPLKKTWAKVESNQTYPEFTCYVTFSYIVYLVVDMCYPKYVNSFIIYSIMISIINQVNAIAFSLRWLSILLVKRQKQAYTVLLSQGSQEYRHMKTERSIYDKKKHTNKFKHDIYWINVVQLCGFDDDYKTLCTGHDSFQDSCYSLFHQ